MAIDDGHSAEDIFRNTYFMVLFFSALWVVGKISARLAMPALVGEIITGIILGPYLLDYVPYPSALKIIGDIGLLLLVLEAGIDVNIPILTRVGTNGLLIAVFGSMLPLLMGSCIALAIDPTQHPRTIVAIGACFAPTSMGIAINVLRNGKVLNTPTGQLIIAAAVLDDVIALILLSVLQEFAGEDPKIIDIIVCIGISPVLIIVFGFIAIKVSPSMIKWIMDKIDIKYHEYAILMMLFAAMLLLVPACFYAKSSYLLGAFLSGLMFCTDHTIHHVWEKQMKRIMLWMLRIFFACTIGFEVPIQDFVTNQKIVTDALLYFIAIIGKLAMGIFATNRPIQIYEFMMISFSMAAWGEFAFILATNAYGSGLIVKDTMTSILMAVLLSVIIAPLFLRVTLVYYHKKQDFYVFGARRATLNSLQLHKSHTGLGSHSEYTPINNSLRSQSGSVYAQNRHNAYYCIHTKTYGKWGHQNRLLKALYSLNLKIIDFRAFNQLQNNQPLDHISYVQDIFYVKDDVLFLFPSRQLNIMSKRQLSDRVKAIRKAIKDALRDQNAQIAVFRWLPGVKKGDDLRDDYNQSDLEKLEKQMSFIAPAYVRNEAYKQARMALSYAHLPRLQNFLGNEMENNQTPTQSNNSISRIDLAHDAVHRTRISHAGKVHKKSRDDLVKLKIDHGDTDSDGTLSLEVMYADDHQRATPDPVTPDPVKALRDNILTFT